MEAGLDSEGPGSEQVLQLKSVLAEIIQQAYCWPKQMIFDSF